MNETCFACPAQEELDKLKFFAKPKLALDAVGGVSAVRICEALAEVSEVLHMLVVIWCFFASSL